MSSDLDMENTVMDEGDVAARFFKHLPRTEDLTMIVLKGHLLVEEQVVALIEQAVPNPKALKGARLHFNQRLKILQALRPVIPARVIAGAEQLNKMRNSLAHELEPKDIVDAISKLATIVKTKRPASKRDEPLSPASELKRAITAVAGALTGVRFRYESLKIPDSQQKEKNKGEAK